MCTRKIRRMIGLLAMLLALGLTASSLAQERCSIAEIARQAQEMGGRWQARYPAGGGETAIDCPIIVPETEKMPVLTVERLKPSKEEFDRVIKTCEMIRPENPRFVLTLENGGVQTIRFGTNGAGLTADYERCQEVWIQQGDYEMIQSDEPVRGYMIIREDGYAWDFAQDAPLADGNNRTLCDAGAFLRGWIEKHYPDAEIDLQLHTASVYSLRRSQDIRDGRTSRETGTDIYEGCFVLSYEQMIAGIPLFAPISELYVNTAQTPGAVSADRKLKAYYQGAWDAQTRVELRYKNDSWFYALMMLDRVREVKREDVPLAPLESVIRNLEKEIEAGRIFDVLALRLGYVLYSDPDTTDWAWAVPCWLADCTTQAGSGGDRLDEVSFWNEWEFTRIPVNAQTAEVIYYGTPVREDYALPEILTW